MGTAHEPKSHKEAYCPHEFMIGIRIAGGVIALVGIVLAMFPQSFGALTGGAAPLVDTFETIERRIRGGMALGVCMLLIAHTSLRPWSNTVAAAVFYIVMGALVVRVMGLMFDGTDRGQWGLVAVELLVLALPAAWLWPAG